MLSSALLRPRPRPRLRLRPAYNTAASPPPTVIKRTHALAAALAASAACYTLGSLYPPPLLAILAPRPAPGPPDPSLPASLAHTAALERALHALPRLASLRAAPAADADWYETRPYARFPEDRRVNSLTAGALRGPGKLALSPLVRARRDESESYVFVHVGHGMCGHDGIVHGGLLATLLDEALARTAIQNLPEKVGVTAHLAIDYKAPTHADQFIVIHTFLTEAKGRKAVVAGRIEDMHGKVLVESSATFVQPRYAKLLNTAALKQAMGEPTAPPLPTAATTTTAAPAT